MASTIFHHWCDRLRALPRARRAWLAASAASIVVLGAFVLGVGVGGGFDATNGSRTGAGQLTARNAALENENQSLRQQQQTAQTTVNSLQQALAARDAEMQKLRRAQVFYAKLIGIDGQRSGLGVHSVELAPMHDAHAWNFTVTLVNTARDADTAKGVLTVAVEGMRAGKLVRLGWRQVASHAVAGGIPFGFKFFQQLHGSLALPQGFVPNRVVVTLVPRSGPRVVHDVPWHEAIVDTRDIALGTP